MATLNATLNRTKAELKLQEMSILLNEGAALNRTKAELKHRYAFSAINYYMTLNRTKAELKLCRGSRIG